MMKRIILPIAAMLVLSCAQYEVTAELTPDTGDVPVWGAQASEDDLDLGHVTVKVTEEFASELEAATGEDGFVRVADTKASMAGVVRMTRLFPDAGEFEARHREYGLHLWYVVDYDPTKSITKAAGDIASMGGIVEIEYPVKTQPLEISDKKVYVTADAPRTASKPTALFNDPKLGNQWHYYNDGSASSSASGCDINVAPVWEKVTTGSSDVIVAVVDQGVDYKHEDLADNMWHNPKESGDSRYGYNFCNSNYTIHPGDHGTHVAGTIAAVNNNGKGVCGIAGGNSAKKIAGVKIMSCQIFDGNKSGAGASAIVWACDNGAIIAQNSWSYTSPMDIPKTLQDAAKYFVQNASGPIKGGLVIFAAGNDDSEKPHGTYDPNGNIISVASVGADYRRAYYSNYGDWVDIAAPGGDARKGNQVLSTFINNRYGYYQGTSMACPHVSGVAALLISKMKGKDVKADVIKSALLGKTTDISAFNPNYKIGKGLVNCYKAIMAGAGKAPSTPTNLQATAFSNNLTVTVTVPKDEDDGKPNAIAVYYSKSAITKTAGVEYALFYVDDVEVGQTLTGNIKDLEFNTKYYLAAQAIDLSDNRSGLSSSTTVTTGSNIPPVLSPRDTTFSFKAHENPELKFKVTNPTGHFFDIIIETEDRDTLAVQVDTTDRENPVVQLTGYLMEEGAHEMTFIVEDLYGDADSCKIHCTILPNHAPYIGKKFDNVLFGSRADDAIRMTATDYFKDDDGETLKYDVSIDGGSANCVYQNGKFILTPMDYGYTQVSITGTDIRGEKVSQSFTCLVRNTANGDIDVYPNPVKTDLHLRTSDVSTSGPNVKLHIAGPTGQQFYDGSLEVSAFAPASIDMRKASPGMYSVSVEYAGQTKLFKIMKI